jgi:sigma-B regulation protein RsbU (phosphoserine phosphatase)
VTPTCKTTGPLLGILEVKEYAVREAQLEMGERLALFTDGVTEAIDPQGEFLGTEGLKRILKQHAAEPVNKLCESVIQEVVDYQDSNLQDDATFLLIQRSGVPTV